jgi:hypothetical protein
MSENRTKRNIKFETETIQIGIDQLQVSPGQIGRYAGGSRYRLNDKMKTLAESMLQKSKQLVEPVFAYAVQPVKINDLNHGLELESGSHVEVPEEEKDPQTVALAPVVCTLGPGLEDETHRLMQKGELLTAMFLDAAGVANLESLGHRARQHVKEKVSGSGLFTGCPFGPGYNNMPLDSQAKLFEHVDAAGIGVQLNDSGVMLPMKSISFWLRITRDKKAAEDHGYKCRKCDMENCIYRKVPYKK